MAANTLEILISQLQDKIATPFQRLTPISGFRKSVALFRILPDVTGSWYFKLAAAKPYALIYQLPDKIATPFQRLSPKFGVQQLNGAIANTVKCNRKSVFQDGGS